jgi:hypothetical protein
MGKGSAPKENPMEGMAAIMQAQVGMAWLQFSQEQFAIANKRQQELIDPLAKRVTEGQIRAQDNANMWGEEDRARWKSVFLPLQDKFIEKANNWDSAERQANVAAEAKADVVSNAEAQREQMRRSMAASGANPASGRWAGVENAAGVEVGLAAAGAQNNARNQVRKEAVALQGDALNIGQGLPSQAVGALGLGVGAGSSAMGTQVAGNNQWMQARSIMDRGFQGAMTGWRGAGEGFNAMHKNQLAAHQMNQQGMGSLFEGIGGIAGLIFSDEDAKEDKREARGILDAVKKMPVEKWKYKEGVADEGEHVGTYAQDFQKQTGLGDGKTIDVVDAIGVTMGAVKELSEQVDRIEAKVSAAPAARSVKRSSGKPTSGGRSIMKEAA